MSISAEDMRTLRTVLGMGSMGQQPTCNGMVATPENIRSLLRLAERDFVFDKPMRDSGSAYSLFVATESGAALAMSSTFKLKEPLR